MANQRTFYPTSLANGRAKNFRKNFRKRFPDGEKHRIRPEDDENRNKNDDSSNGPVSDEFALLNRSAQLDAIQQKIRDNHRLDTELISKEGELDKKETELNRQIGTARGNIRTLDAEFYREKNSLISNARLIRAHILEHTKELISKLAPLTSEPEYSGFNYEYEDSELEDINAIRVAINDITRVHNSLVGNRNGTAQLEESGPTPIVEEPLSDSMDSIILSEKIDGKTVAEEGVEQKFSEAFLEMGAGPEKEYNYVAITGVSPASLYADDTARKFLENALMEACPGLELGIAFDPDLCLESKHEANESSNRLEECNCHGNVDHSVTIRFDESVTDEMLTKICSRNGMKLQVEGKLQTLGFRYAHEMKRGSGFRCAHEIKRESDSTRN